MWKSNASTARRDQRVELREAVQHPALELGHRLDADRLLRREVVERAQQIAQRVAQAAVDIALVLQDLRADAQILGIVGADHPEPQDVGAALLHHVLRRDDVAERFRHLAALLVEHEAVGQHRVVRGAAARAAGFEQRGVEPAAMLVRAFEIKRGRPVELGPLLEHEGVGRAGIEPDIDDVGDLLAFRRVAGVAEKLRRIGA